jgi:hypothetical protein
MDAMTFSQDDWNEAVDRLFVLFETMDFGGIEHRTRVVMEIVGSVRARDLNGRAPVEACLDEVDERLKLWFQKALGDSAGQTKNRIATGLLAWNVTGGSSRWGDVILAGEPPEELVRVFSGVRAQTGPDLAISSMTPREMDFGAIESLAQETWHQFAWAPLLRAAILWTIVFFVVLAIHDRFFIP